MKKILLLSILISGGAWADASCKNKQHAPVPKLKGMDSMVYDSKGRSALLKDKWKPIPLSKEEQEDMTFFNKQTPEKYCSATLCISNFQDNKGNELTVTQVGDFITDIEIECK